MPSIFELSKCQRIDIRSRAVSHLRNIDEDLAARVAKGLRLDLPDPAKAAMPTLDLPTSDKLSILANPPLTFRGRKLGIILTDGSDAALFAAIAAAVEDAGAVWEVIAPHIGGVTLDDGSAVAARQKIDGGPSVLYDAVAILPSQAGAALLAQDSAAKDFVSDAFAHCKFIGHSAEAEVLFEMARVPDERDAGFVLLESAEDVEGFVDTCADLRFWPRERHVDLDAQA